MNTFDITGLESLKYTLWKFYDIDGGLLYVTKNVNQATMKSKDWWYKAVRTTMTHFSNAGELENAKIVAIDNEKSKYNVYGRDL